MYEIYKSKYLCMYKFLLMDVESLINVDLAYFPLYSSMRVSRLSQLSTRPCWTHLAVHVKGGPTVFTGSNRKTPILNSNKQHKCQSVSFIFSSCTQKQKKSAFISIILLYT